MQLSKVMNAGSDFVISDLKNTFQIIKSKISAKIIKLNMKLNRNLSRVEITSKNHTSKVATAIREIRMMSGTRFPSAKTIEDVCKKHNLNENNIRIIGGFKDSKGYQYIRD